MKTILLIFSIISFSSCLKNDWKCSCTTEVITEYKNGTKKTENYVATYLLKKTTKRKAEKTQCANVNFATTQTTQTITIDKICRIN